MGKTRNLLEKIRDTKGTFHVKMGSIKDRNSMDPTEPEDIKRGDKDTQNYIETVLMNWAGSHLDSSCGFLSHFHTCDSVSCLWFRAISWYLFVHRSLSLLHLIHSFIP